MERMEKMEIGMVVGPIGTRKQAGSLQDTKFLLVENRGKEFAAADFTGAETGDRVLIVTGGEAGKYAMGMPVDAAVVAVLSGK